MGLQEGEKSKKIKKNQCCSTSQAVSSVQPELQRPSVVGPDETPHPGSLWLRVCTVAMTTRHISFFNPTRTHTHQHQNQHLTPCQVQTHTHTHAHQIAPPWNASSDAKQRLKLMPLFHLKDGLLRAFMAKLTVRDS